VQNSGNNFQKGSRQKNGSLESLFITMGVIIIEGIYVIHRGGVIIPKKAIANTFSIVGSTPHLGSMLTRHVTATIGATVSIKKMQIRVLIV